MAAEHIAGLGFLLLQGVTVQHGRLHPSPDFNKGPNWWDKGKARRGKGSCEEIQPPPHPNQWKIVDCGSVINSADKNCYQMSLFIYSI